jgi:hypothetical protein
MLRDPTFGKRLAGADILLGLAALVGISWISIAQDNPNDYAFVVLAVVLPLLRGGGSTVCQGPIASLGSNL